MHKITRSLILFLPLLVYLNGYAQSGCTDPQASNYDPNAVVNDGSCSYAATTHQLTNLSTLPDDLEESSGLSFLDGNLWTHNDGGNPDKIYRIDSLTGTILQEVIVATADNIDWEDLTENDTHLFIGDFGNNPGNRMDLAIHRIDKNSLSSNIVNSEVINFSYSDQASFPNLPNDNDFDCEAFFYLNDSLHLFSKNWVTEKTRHYTLPNQPGTHVAQLRGEFNVQGLISSAAIDEEGNVVLLGYSTGGSSFMWLLHDYPGTEFFSGNKRFVSLGSAVNTSQVEGICFKTTGYGYVSAERFSVLAPKLFSFDLNPFLQNIISSNNNIFSSIPKVYPNPVDNILTIEFPEGIGPVQILLIRSDGKIIMNSILNDRINFLETSSWVSGVYFLRMNVGEEILNYRVVR